MLFMALIADVRFASNHYVQLISVSTFSSDTLLQSRAKLEGVIHTILPTAPGFQKELQVAQVVLYNIPMTKDDPTHVMTEVEFCNPNISHSNALFAG